MKSGAATPLLSALRMTKPGGLLSAMPFFISEMVPFSTGGADDGKISLNKGWDPDSVALKSARLTRFARGLQPIHPRKHLSIKLDRLLQ
jgi:hypothetical protein